MRDRAEDDSVDSTLVGGGYTLYEALKRDHEARADPLPVAGDD